MTNPMISRLTKVSLREAWPHEAADFTPWLAKPENLELLGDAIGMKLELEAEEKSVGPFRADIVCRDLVRGAFVLIENQLECTDHSHLGQLLTYAAGLEVTTIVWIAKSFTDEHRAAIDWLNNKTPSDISLFGLEIEVWRIGDSAMAPKFNIVCQPNDWSRSVTASIHNSELRQFCTEYWSGVLFALQEMGMNQVNSRPAGKQDMTFDVGWNEFVLKAYFSRVKKKLGVWVGCRGPDGSSNFELLKRSTKEIEAALDGPLDWSVDELKNTGSCVFYISGYDANDRADWVKQHRLIAEKLRSLYCAVNPLIESLSNEIPGAPFE